MSAYLKRAREILQDSPQAWGSVALRNSAVLLEILDHLEEQAAQTGPSSSAPPSLHGPAIGPCPWCSANLVAVQRWSDVKSWKGEPTHSWVCSKCSTEVLIPLSTLDKPIVSTSNGNEASAEIPGPTAHARRRGPVTREYEGVMALPDMADASSRAAGIPGEGAAPVTGSERGSGNE